jgi:hypothetical protein
MARDVTAAREYTGREDHGSGKSRARLHRDSRWLHRAGRRRWWTG